MARVAVESEEEPSRMLLETKIHNGDGFQKQQGMSRPLASPSRPRSHGRVLIKAADTLIVWTEPQTGIDMALSFQEAEGCATIWFVMSPQNQQWCC